MLFIKLYNLFPNNMIFDNYPQFYSPFKSSQVFDMPIIKGSYKIEMDIRLFKVTSWWA